MQMLKAKLYLIKEQENREKLSDIRGEVSDNGWGNQIRSYVMQPYTMVKDHRTGEETGNVQSVMDGNLDAFMNANWRRNLRLKKNRRKQQYSLLTRAIRFRLLPDTVKK